MTKTYTWTTARGARIEITATVEHITSKLANADGWDINVDCNEWSRNIDRCVVNGKPTSMKQLTVWNGVRCILIGYQGKSGMYIALPQTVENEMYGEEIAELNAELDRAAAAEKACDAHRNMMRRVMGY